MADAPQAAADGFDYFETTVAEALMPDKGEEAWQENKLRLRDIELPLYACNGFLPGTMRLTGPNARPEQALDYAEGACRRADEIGCKFIVFASGGARNVPGDFTKPGERPDVERGRDQFAEFCAGLAERISGCRVTVVIEPLCPNESNIINYVWQAMQIVKDVDSPRMEVLAAARPRSRLSPPARTSGTATSPCAAPAPTPATARPSSSRHISRRLPRSAMRAGYPANAGDPSARARRFPTPTGLRLRRFANWPGRNSCPAT